MSRETYYAALFSVLDGLRVAGTVKVVTRRFSLQDAAKPQVLPAIHIDGDREEVTCRPGLPPRRRLSVRLFAYVAVDVSRDLAGVVLSAMIDTIEAVLAPIPSQSTQTLGGICAHCWIEGTIERFETGLPGMALAIIPVHILVP